MTQSLSPKSKSCAACKKDIENPRKNQEFCSTQCRKAKGFYGTYCIWCKKELIIPGGKRKETRFCSLSCSRQSLYRRNNPSYDENCFAEPNLINSYWAGFIAADGFVSRVRGQGRLTVKLSSRDRKHLEALQSYIGAGKIYTFDQTLDGSSKIYEMSRYQLHSGKIVSDLADVFNIHPAKSLTHKPPNLTGDLAHAFIAGYIDGDGSYSHAKRKYPVLSVLGTPEFLAWVYSVYEVDRKPMTTATNIHAISFAGAGALRVRASYRNLGLPLLERKRNRWVDIGLVTDIDDEIETS